MSGPAWLPMRLALPDLLWIGDWVSVQELEASGAIGPAEVLALCLSSDVVHHGQGRWIREGVHKVTVHVGHLTVEEFAEFTQAALAIDRMKVAHVHRTIERNRGIVDW